MHRKRCSKCGFNHTKKMEKGIKNKDTNALIVVLFLRTNVEDQTE